MKSHEMLLAKILVDSSIWCCTSTTQDLKTILRRVEHEGDSFLTITLPSFGKDFESCLALERVDSTLFSSFKKRACLPAFLQGFTSQVFNPVSGELLDSPSIEAIRCVRQICYLFHKLELPCSEERVSAAFDGYIECEEQVKASTMSSDDPLLADYQRVSRLVFGKLFSDIDKKVFDATLLPKHGPGATADRLKGNDKYVSKLWTERLEEIFPAMDYLYTSPRHYFDAIEDGAGPNWLEPGNEIPVRVITVPKTLRTPRIIAIEPAHMQYVQQALMEQFVKGIERNDSLLCSFIGFSDQQVNRDLARQGSLNGELATLDLSEASDRVSIQHVEYLFRDYSWLSRAVFACRSTHAEVPGHGVIRLAKYASMGSALTFPIEAMVFFTIILIGIEKELNSQMSPKLLQELRGHVRVYGDDLIVPVRYVQSVAKTLEAFGLKVNFHKSFGTGSFRESCGGDYYSGHDVTVIRLRKRIPQQRQHGQEIASAVSFRNQLYWAGYWSAADFMDDLIRKLIPFPIVHETSPGLGRQSVLDYQAEKDCPHLQRPLVKAATLCGLSPKSRLSGQDALLKYFLKRGSEPFADQKHLERAGRPDAVTLKLRWVRPF